MSILSRLAVNRHLTDEDLAEIWSASPAGNSAAAHPHLAACAHCRGRYATFTHWLDELRADAHAEADDLLTPERLAAQQAQILRRLEGLERPAKVIAFPKAANAARDTRRFLPRWVPTAIAAGLVIGLAAGRFMVPGENPNRLARTPAGAVATDSGERRPGVQPALFSSDEAIFYGDVEVEFAARSAQYIPTLDDLTPRAREGSDRPR